MKKFYPTYNNGFVNAIDYPKLIQMQSQEPIGIISNQKVTLHGQSVSNKSEIKRSLKRTTKK